jgi:hypothetical protein
MKQLLTTLFFLFTLSSFSQNNNEVRKYNDGWQKGYHIFVDGQWKAHGNWKHQYGKALYDKGKLVWIKLKNDRKWTNEEIKIAQLEKRIEKLKQELASK